MIIAVIEKEKPEKRFSFRQVIFSGTQNHIDNAKLKKNKPRPPVLNSTVPPEPTHMCTSYIHISSFKPPRFSQ